MTPENTLASTYKTIIWLCENGHDWPATGLNRVKGNNCRHCSNHSCWTGWNDLATTPPELAADWDWENNGDLRPEKLIAGTGMPIAWRCSTYDQRWPAPGGDGVRGRGCPECFRTKPHRHRR